MSYQKPACVPQWTPNIPLPKGKQIFDVAEDHANVPLQTLLHQVETQKQDVLVVNRRVDKKLFVLASHSVSKEIKEKPG